MGLLLINLIPGSAILSDLPIGAGERADVSHLKNGSHKISEEAIGIVAVGLNNGVGSVLSSVA